MITTVLNKYCVLVVVKFPTLFYMNFAYHCLLVNSIPHEYWVPLVVKLSLLFRASTVCHTLLPLIALHIYRKFRNSGDDG